MTIAGRGAGFDRQKGLGKGLVAGILCLAAITAEATAQVFNKRQVASHAAFSPVESITPCAPIPDGLVAWYRFEETSGNLMTDHAGPHDAQVFGAQRLPGLIGQAALFDGVDDSLLVTMHPCIDGLGADDFAVDAWVGPGSHGPIASKYAPSGEPGWEFGVTSDGYLYFQARIGLLFYSAQSTIKVPTADWALAAMSVDVDGSNLVVQFSINGADAGNLWATSYVGGFASQSDLILGASFFGDFFTGFLDEVELFDQSVSLAEFQAIYAAGPKGKCTPCDGVPQAWRTSSFDHHAEGWNVIQPNGNEAPVWLASGGNPGGCIERSDAESGSFVFQAPAYFLGNRSFTRGIYFDWRSDDIDASGRNVGVNLYRDGDRISVSSPTNDQYENTWLRYDFPFLPAVGWVWNGGAPATQAQMKFVLANVTDIRITGESKVGHTETTRLDNPTFYLCRRQAVEGCAPIPEGLVAWYRFEESTGSVMLDSAGPHDAQVFGAQRTTGQIGQAALFDGINDELRVSVHPCIDEIGADEFAVDAWVGPGATGTIASKFPVSGFPGWEFGINPTGNLYLMGPDNCLSYWMVSTTTLPASDWALAAVSVSVDGTNFTVEFSINGLDAGTFGPFPVCGGFASRGEMLLGASSFLGAHYAGLLDEVEIFGRAVTRLEFQVIAAYRDAGKCTPCQGPRVAAATSRFNASREGWTVWQPNNPSEAPVWVAAGGVPGGYIQRTDQESGSSAFVAPAAFQGNFSAARGAYFDWRSSLIDATGRRVGITIYSGANRIGVSCPVNSLYQDTWLRYHFPFLPTVGWLWNGGPPATQAQIQSVIANITDLRITCESLQGHSEVTGLDNPTLYTCGNWGTGTGGTGTYQGELSVTGTPGYRSKTP